MSLNSLYISSRQLIDEVLRDNQYTIELPWEDAIEWISDAMELIKVPTQYINKRAVITVEDYRAALPCDFHLLTQVAGSTGGCYPFPMLDSSNTFHPTQGSCDLEEAFNYINGTIEGTESSLVTAPIGEDIAGNPVYELNGDNFALPSTQVVVNNTFGLTNATYNINNNFIFTNFREGCIFLAYKAFPIDDQDGFPLIPDNTKYKKAVGAYIRARVDFLLWRKGDITRDVYDDAEQQWCWYVGAAQNAARIPTIDKVESMKNMNKLVMNRFHHSNFFNNLNS